MPTRRMKDAPIARRTAARRQTSRFGAQSPGYGRISRATTSNEGSRRSLGPVDRRIASDTTWRRYGRAMRRGVGRLASPRREAERILNGAARRLLAEQLERDAVWTTTRTDGSSLDGRTNQSPALVQREPVPILVRIDR